MCSDKTVIRNSKKLPRMLNNLVSLDLSTVALIIFRGQKLNLNKNINLYSLISYWNSKNHILSCLTIYCSMNARLLDNSVV